MNSKFKFSSSGISLMILKLILIIQVILILYPVAFTVSASFIADNSLSAVGTVPFSRPFSMEQFRRLFTETNYGHWYLNTLKVACMNTIITVFVCSFTGYIFSRFYFPFKKTVMASMLVLQMFPSFIGMVATYVLLWKITLFICKGKKYLLNYTSLRIILYIYTEILKHYDYGTGY